MRKTQIDKDFYKTFSGLTIKIACQNILSCFINLCGNFFLAFYSESAVIGGSLTHNFQYFFQMLIGVISEGVLLLIANYFNKGEYSNLKVTFCFYSLIAFILGIIFSASLFFSPLYFLQLFNKENGVTLENIRYFKIFALQYPIFSLNQVIISTLNGIKKNNICLSSSILGLLFCILLNLLFLVKAKFNNSANVALSILLSQILELIIFVIYIKYKLLFRLNKFKIDLLLMKKQLKIILPLIISHISWGIYVLFQAHVVGELGSLAIAINGMANMLYGIFSTLPNSLCRVSILLTNDAIKKNNISIFKERLRILSRLLFIGSIINAFLMYTISISLIYFFNVSTSVKLLTKNLIFIFSIILALASYHIPIIAGVLPAIRKINYMLKMDLLSMWCFAFPLILVVKLHFSNYILVILILLKSDQIFKFFAAKIKLKRILRVEKWQNL